MRTEDGYIINKCLNGEKEAFGFLVDKYQRSVYAFAYSKLRNFHDAEDIAQEVFIKAFQKLHTLRRWDNFLAWLYSITSNKCKNLIRSKSNRPDREFIADQDSSYFDYTSMDSYQEKQAIEWLYEGLDSLPQMYQEVLTLHYLGGMRNKEIARFLGTSESNIKQRLRRARSKLKKEMLDMISTTFDQQKLQPSFTFRIVEMVKRIKIKPAPSKPLLPLGLSAATGIVLTVMMLSPHLISLTLFGALLGSPLPSETKVTQVGELPVDVLDISEITFLSSDRGDGDSGAENPNQQNALAPPLAPSGKGGTWTKKADMPTARKMLSACVVDGKIYAIGGGGQIKNQFLATLEVYDPATDTWTRKADMPTARNTQNCASVVNGKIYAIGANNMQKWVSTVEEYDPETDTWRKKKADMPTLRSHLSTSAVNGKIYAIGGCRKGKPWPSLAIVEEYDPATDTWTKKADIPTSRSDFDTAAVNGKIYAIGGVTGPYFGGTVLSTVEEYDPTTDTWTRKADMPIKTRALAASVLNGKIYVFAGGDGVRLQSTVLEYDPMTDAWREVADMPFRTGYFSSAAVGEKLYVIGGSGPGNVVFPTMEEYTPEGWQPSQAVSPHGKLPTTWGEMKSGK